MASRFFLQSVAGSRYARSEKKGLVSDKFDFGTYTAASRISKLGAGLEDSSFPLNISVARTQSLESGYTSPKSATERCDCAALSGLRATVWECANTAIGMSKQAQKTFITRISFIGKTTRSIPSFRQAQ